MKKLLVILGLIWGLNVFCFADKKVEIKDNIKQITMKCDNCGYIEIYQFNKDASETYIFQTINQIWSSRRRDGVDVYFDTWNCQLNWTNEQDSKNLGMSPDSYIMPANKKLREKVAKDQAINTPKILNFVK